MHRWRHTCGGEGLHASVCCFQARPRSNAPVQGMLVFMMLLHQH